MKFSAITFAASVLVAAVAGQDTSAIYEVTNFKAACIAHSTQCFYSFDVLEPGTMQTIPQHCAAKVTQGAIHELPAVEKGTCEQTSRTWTIVKSANGLALSVSTQVSPISFKTGVHQISSTELKIVVSAEDPTGAHQTYTGPEAFSLYRADS